MPLQWSPEKNVAWTADVPGYGQSSPIIWGDRILILYAQDVLARTGQGQPIIFDVKCSQALGPFDQPLNRVLAKRLLPRMHVVLARGEDSYSNVQGLGLQNIRLARATDLAFTLPHDEPLERRLAERLDPLRSRGTVLFMPSAVVEGWCERHGIEHDVAFAELVREVCNRLGAAAVLAPHSFRATGKPRRMDDARVCRSVAARLQDRDDVVLIDEDLSPAQLRALVDRADLVVTSRFHGMVTGLLLAMEMNEAEDGLSALELRLENVAAGRGGRAGLAFEDEAALKLGDAIAIHCGDESSPAEIFRGVISALEADFPEESAPQLVVLAEDTLQKARMKRRTRTYESQTLADIATAIAGDLGLTPRVDGFTQQSGTQVQMNESDLAFLRRLLARHDGDVQVVGAELHVAPRSGVRRGTVELARFEGSVLTLRLTGSLHGCPGTAYVKRVVIEPAIKSAAPALRVTISR